MLTFFFKFVQAGFVSKVFNIQQWVVIKLPQYTLLFAILWPTPHPFHIQIQFGIIITDVHVRIF